MRNRFDRYLIDLATRHVITVLSLPQQRLPAGVSIELPLATGKPWDGKPGVRLLCDNEDLFHICRAILISERRFMSVSLETKPGWDWAVAAGSRTNEAAWLAIAVTFMAICGNALSNLF